MEDLSDTTLRLLESPIRKAIVDILSRLPHVPAQDAPSTRDRGLSAAELADELGVHVTTARFHLDQLLAAGLLDSHDERGQVGRPRRCYRALATPSTEILDSDAYRHFTQLIDAALDHPEGVDAEELGRTWLNQHADQVVSPHPFDAWPPAPATNRLEWLGKLGALLDMLDQWGYAPELSTSKSGHEAQLRLHSCPMLDRARAHPELVCSAHKGVLRGMLDALGESDASLDVTPVFDGVACVATTVTPIDLIPSPHRATPPSTKGAPA
ncbi:metalloregulator ArsR/SmtB family transcription factor [uncultured Tessaracoccus sp.]|uniref:helix-turn-helix transcriptional regulator n=1 Tax=uncultured Tessaracoccus sp. TaxID=905023 RepID=UPI0025F749EE|nr:helix-turn-helix domain-containing protein [uncultured Tessaracoccus sp.]